MELILEESGVVEGDATVTGGGIVLNGGSIRGEMRTLDAGGDEVEEEIERVMEGEVEAVRRVGPDGEAVVRVQRESREHWEERSKFSFIRSGFMGLISTVAFGLLLGGLGALLIFYGRPYLDTVSDTIRSATLRSAAVGLAASFLVIPAYVVLLVALAVSIIGIPFLLIAVPFYPVAVAAAAGMGLLAAAHALGERTSEQRNDAFDFRYRNAYAYLFTGLGMLLLPLVAANLVEMTGFLGFLGVLLKILTCTVIWAAATIGFGAVILSRAGTQRTFVPRPMDPDLGSDSFYDSDPYTPGPNV